VPTPVAMKPVSVKASPYHEKHAVGHHVGDVEDLAVGGNANVLGHASLRQFQESEDFWLRDINLHQAVAELACKYCVTAID
jgi:hypothetical protein